MSINNIIPKLSCLGVLRYRELKTKLLPVTQPTTTLVYIHIPGDPQHIEYAKQFVASYQQYPPQISHDIIIVCNGAEPNEETQRIFAALPRHVFFEHDDSGWDIGGYIAAAKTVTTDIQICLGGSSYFKRAGWLERMSAVWQECGPGVYGSNSSYEISPHLNTNGFWCPPQLLTSYPHPVINKADRYAFEHGRPYFLIAGRLMKIEPLPPRMLWYMAYSAGFPARLVTWEGVYDWWDWRKPNNIFRRGDQSNCLVGWHHHEDWNKLPPTTKAVWARLADTLTDINFDLVNKQINL